MNRRQAFKNTIAGWLGLNVSSQLELEPNVVSLQGVSGTLREFKIDSEIIKTAVHETFNRLTRSVVIKNGVPELIVRFSEDEIIDMGDICAATG